MMNEHKNNNDDDDDRPQLSAETLKALEEWRQEQEQNRVADVKEEDWVNRSVRFFSTSIFIIFVAIESILVQSGNCTTTSG